jgi:hypothetical protein
MTIIYAKAGDRLQEKCKSVLSGIIWNLLNPDAISTTNNVILQ